MVAIVALDLVSSFLVMRLSGKNVCKMRGIYFVLSGTLNRKLINS